MNWRIWPERRAAVPASTNTSTSVQNCGSAAQSFTERLVASLKSSTVLLPSDGPASLPLTLSTKGYSPSCTTLSNGPRGCGSVATRKGAFDISAEESSGLTTLNGGCGAVHLCVAASVEARNCTICAGLSGLR